MSGAAGAGGGHIEFIDSTGGNTGDVTDPNTNQNPGAGNDQNAGGQGNQNPPEMEDQELDDMLKVFGVENAGSEEADPLADYKVDTNIPEDSPIHPARQQAAMKAVGTQLNDQITNAVLPDDMIPADFNGNDPTQVKDLMTNVMRHTMRQAIGLMLKPVQTAMAHQNDTMMHNIANQIKQSQGSMVARSKLEAMVPQMATQAGRTMLGPINQQLESQGKSLAERASVLNALCKRLNLDAAGKPKSTGDVSSDSSGMTIKSGMSALDDLFTS